MKGQFSLRRLLVGMTVFCIVTGLIAAFPRQAVASSHGILFVVASGVWTYYSRAPAATFCSCLLGALLTFALWPTLHVSSVAPPTAMQLYLLGFFNHAVPPAIGAAVAGFLSLFLTGVRD